jgi:2-isopropylmalate synthase
MKEFVRLKYQPIPRVSLPDRQWPSREITEAPRWCSVDLRDGNQALAIPMNLPEKLEMFDLLVKTGFKEIEVGFPSASQIEFDFIRKLIDENLVPEDVYLQVLVQAREDLIARTVESLKGAKKAIIHLYNSTSPLQRKVVFGLEKEGIVEIAKKGTQWVKGMLDRLPGTEVRFQYSPESFSSTEIEFSLEICEAVMEIWQPTAAHPIILNLPGTVEYQTPNVYADQIEWFCRHMKHRDHAIISLHTHNDRGTGVAATELGIMAGAQRVEGTLFGNGERTGNLDLVTVALNLHMHGVDSGLEFSNLPEVREIYERCTRMSVHERHPYAGDLVFTAFSGSHQDAINKGFKHMKDKGDHPVWEVPYLPIDPQDLGRSYDAIIRINSQSGKGGVAYVMEKDFGFQLPKAMHRDLGKLVNEFADKVKREVTPQEIYDVFAAEYLEANQSVTLKSFVARPRADGSGVEASVDLKVKNEDCQLTGQGNGPIDALMHALVSKGLARFEVLSYSEHSLGKGAEAKAVAYIEAKDTAGRVWFGAGMDTNIELASIKAVISALNRMSK